MKKTSILLAAGVLASAILFSGCKDPFSPIFYNIRQDVKPEAATVNGTINSITRYTVDGNEILILAANEGLRYKLATTGNNRESASILVGSSKKVSKGTSWKVFNKESLPFEFHHFNYFGEGGTPTHIGQTILKFAADDTTLYMLTTEYTHLEAEGISFPSVIRIWANNNFTWENGTLKSSKEDWIEIAVEEYSPDKDDSKTESYDFFTFTNDSRNKLLYTDFNIFCTNSINKEHRSAYLRTGYIALSNTEEPAKSNERDSKTKLYKLAGTTKLSSANLIEAKSFDTERKADIDNVVYFDGDYLFFDTSAVATNEAKDIEPTVIYYAGTKLKSDTNLPEIHSEYNHTHESTDALYYVVKNSSGELTKTQFIEKLGVPATCFAVTKDALLIGRGDSLSSSSYSSGGIVKTDLNDGIPANTLSSFTTNASIQLSNPYLIHTLLAVDPLKTELDNIIYSSIGFKSSGSAIAVSYNNIGLWAYYPDEGRGNWNKE